MTATMRVSGPADLLPLVPHVLGFTPESSAVVMSVNARGRVGVTARYDLPDDSQVAMSAAADLLPLLLREGAAGVLMVGYEDAPGQARLFLDSFGRVLGLAGIVVLDSLSVHGDRWARADEPGAGGTVPAMPEAVAAEFVGLGRSPLPDRASLEACFRARPDAERVGAVCDGRSVPRAGRALEEAARAWAAVLDPSGVPVGAVADEVLAAAVVGLRCVGLRDALMGLLVTSLRPIPASPALAALRGILPPFGGREAEVSERLREVSTLLPDRHAAPVATLLASLYWEQGDGARTLIALDRARAAEPDYQLAALLTEMVRRGIRYH